MNLANVNKSIDTNVFNVLNVVLWLQLFNQLSRCSLRVLNAEKLELCLNTPENNLDLFMTVLIGIPSL